MHILTSTQPLRSVAAFTACVCAAFMLSTGTALAGHGNCRDVTALEIGLATWDGATLTVEGCVEPRSEGDVEVFDAGNDNSLGVGDLKNSGHWKRTSSTCAENVYAKRGAETTATFPVSGPGCGGGGENPPVCTIDTPAGDVTILVGGSVSYTGTAEEDEGGTLVPVASYSWTFEGGTPSSSIAEDPLSVTYNTAGVYTTTFDATDNDGQTCVSPATRTITVNEPGEPPVLPNQTELKIMMNYELGMHCTGFEFAYCCVLPAYNSILAQVVKPGNKTQEGYPRLLEADPNENVASILAGGTGDVLGRHTVVRDRDLDSAGNFQKYVLRYWHEAQPRNDGRGAPQDFEDRKISSVELNSLLSWNTVADAADLNTDGTYKLSGAPVHPDDPDCVPDPGADPPACLNTHPLYNGAAGVVLGNGSYADRDVVFTSGAAGAVVDTPIDNYQNAVWNHLYIYEVSAAGVEGAGGMPAGDRPESDKIRLGLHVGYPTNFGPGGHAMEGLLTYSGESGTVVYTQMKVLEDLPIMLTSPRIWEALGLPLTPFEDTIGFFSDPGLVDEDSVRPYVQMKARLHHAICDGAGDCTEGDAVLDSAGNEVIGFGTAPIDIPNCERCHSAFDSPNSPNVTGTPEAELVQQEINFWKAYYPTMQTGVDWYARLKGAAVSILATHDTEHGTSFLAEYPGVQCSNNPDPILDDVNVEPLDDFPGPGDIDHDLDGDFQTAAEKLTRDCVGLDVSPGNPGAGTNELVLAQNTRAGHESVICQKCHADNVIAVVKSTYCGPGSNPLANPDGCADGDLIPPLTEAIHYNHREFSEGGPIRFQDSLGRSGGCQGCHPAHRSDGDMAGYPIDLDGNNFYAALDNRDANGGCFVGRDVHSNPMKDIDGAETDSYLNPVGQWLFDNVASDGSGNWEKGVWCTNCHNQAGQQLWKAENVADHVNAQPGDAGNVREPFVGAGLSDVVTAVNAALGTTTSLPQFESWLDPKGKKCVGGGSPGAACYVDGDCDGGSCDGLSADGTDQTSAIWAPDPGLCDYVASLAGAQEHNPAQDANVAVVEVLIGGSQTGDGACSNAGNGNAFAVPVDCGFVQFDICGSTDTDGDFNVNVVGNSEPDAGPLGGVFCTTPDCVASAQSTLGACALNLGDNCAVPVPFSAATDGRDHWLSAGEPHCADCHAAPYVEQSGNVNAFPPFNYPRKSSLMRYSRGHQDITCQGCHESIHGLYPVTPLIDTTSYAQAASLNADNTHGPLKCGTCHTVDTATGIPLWMGFGSHDIPYNGAGPVELKDGVLDRNSYEEMVGWMHTYTEEANPLESTCLACHAPKGTEWAMLTSDNTKWYRHKKPANDGDFTPKFTINKIDRGAMDAAEKAKTAGDPAGPCPTVEGGCVFGDPDPDDDGDTVWNGGDVDNPGEDPSVTVCLGCHTPTGKNNNIEGKLDTVPGCVGDTGIIQTWKTHLAQGRVSEKVWTAVSEHVIGSTCGW